MRGKDFNTGLRGVLFEARHYQRMGSAVWLYAWLVLRQTHQTGSVGWVLGGAPVSYKEIEEETGFNARTLERWMSTLRRHGYIETEPATGGLVVRITKAKKHSQSARNSADAQRTETLRKAAHGLRKLAGGPRRVAEGNPQNCGSGPGDVNENTQLPAAICSSSVEESLEGYIRANTEREPIAFANAQDSTVGSQKQFQNQQLTKLQNPNPSCSGESQNQLLTQPNSTRDPFAGPGRTPGVRVLAPQKPWLSRDDVRLQLELLRAEREEAVRRELYVGRGPEIRRPAEPSAAPEPEAKPR
jgi:hypothetical protein